MWNLVSFLIVAAIIVLMIVIYKDKDISGLTWTTVILTTLSITGFYLERNIPEIEQLAFCGREKSVSINAKEDSFKGLVAAKGQGRFNITAGDQLSKDKLGSWWIAQGNDEPGWGDSIEDKGGRHEKGKLNCIIDVPVLDIKEPISLNGFLSIPAVKPQPLGDGYHFRNIYENTESEEFNLKVFPSHSNRLFIKTQSVHRRIALFSGIFAVLGWIGAVVALFEWRKLKSLKK